MPCSEYRLTQSLGRIISQKTSVMIQAKEVMPQNVMFVIMSKIASIQDVIKKHLPLFTSIDAIILSSVNPMTLCNLEKVVRERALTTITINIPCSQEPLQELVLSIVEMPTCIFSPHIATTQTLCDHISRIIESSHTTPPWSWLSPPMTAPSVSPYSSPTSALAAFCHVQAPL